MNINIELETDLYNYLLALANSKNLSFDSFVEKYLIELIAKNGSR